MPTESDFATDLRHNLQSVGINRSAKGCVDFGLAQKGNTDQGDGTLMSRVLFDGKQTGPAIRTADRSTRDAFCGDA
jgi:hypothetical protein